MPADSVFSLGHSPDPDDAFMFYALAEHKIDTRGYRFEHVLQDIETLNERATRGELHISAISIHAYAYVLEKYALLPCGASMGDGYGPLLVTADHDAPDATATDDEVRGWLKQQMIAIPGTMTTAYLALRLYLGHFNSVKVPFDEIFAHVATKSATVGLIIHEGQLTYAQAGFRKVLDLGEWWKRTTGLPLPLGGNVIRKDISPAVRHDLSQLLQESIRHGLENRSQAVTHSLKHARGMEAPLADQFISMYVNAFTLDYGEIGRRAIHHLLARAHEEGIIPAPVELEFVT